MEADADTLRAQLMARDPMQRMLALHALQQRAARSTLAGEVGRFADRGVPYYAPGDSHYQAWVERALSYWRRMPA